MRDGLARHADPIKAVPMQAYMKSSMPYLGVQLPLQRTVWRAVFPDFALTSFDQWRATILALWDQAQFREERYAALGLAGERRYRAYAESLDAVSLYEYLIVNGAWWDLVDDVATHRVGDLIRLHYEQMRPTLLAWSRVEDHWLRRTSIICQVGSKQATDAELLFACIEPSLAERDFFLRKAIGWALREYAKTMPQAVWQYVHEHEQQLSGLSRREALKHLHSRCASG